MRAWQFALAASMSSLPRTGQSLLWFPDAPNNLGDLDGLTEPDGSFFLRYNNGACGRDGGSGSGWNNECEASGPGGHCRAAIRSFGSATSSDGVHWVDHGTQMTQFDEGRSCPDTGSGSGSVWAAPAGGPAAAASRTRAGKAGKQLWVINYSHGGVIRFMTAPTPNGPWSPVGSTAPPNATTVDGFGPGRRPPRPADGRQWYNGRWDTANAWPAPHAAAAAAVGHGPEDPPAPRVYFWISATAIGANNSRQVGHASSADGVNWTALPPAVVTDWGGHNYTGGPFESGGCAYAAAVQKWYCLNGFRGSWMSVDGTRGMATFVADRPGGPYRIADKNPLVMAYRSCAYLPETCDSATYFARFWLRYDAPDPSSPPELLVVHQSYSQSTAMVYLAPLKKAEVDDAGTMRLVYWQGNEKMKGPPLAGLGVGASDEGGVRNLSTPLNNRNGTVLEGRVAERCGAASVVIWPIVGSSGDVFEIGLDDALNMAVWRTSRGGARSVIDSFDRALGEVPAPAGGGCHFRLLLRGSLAELYVNDVLHLPFALPNTVSPGGYNASGAGGWANGARAPAVTVGLGGGWAGAEVSGWLMDLPALFPQR